VGGRKSPFPITLAIGLYNSLYYCTSRDCSGPVFMRHTVVPLGYSSSVAKHASGYFSRQAIGLVWQRMYFGLSIYALELCKDLVVIVDLPRPTVRHPETILHKGCCTTVQSSTDDRLVSLVWFTGSFTFEPGSAQLHSSPSINQSGLTTRTVVADLFWSLTSQKGDLITKRSQY